MFKFLRSYKEFLDEGFLTANYLRKITYRTSGNISGNIYYDAFKVNNPDISVLRTFGSKSFVHAPKQRIEGKLSARSISDIIVGYIPVNHYGVLVRTGPGRSVVVSKDVSFDESGTEFWEIGTDPGPMTPITEKNVIFDWYQTDAS